MNKVDRLKRKLEDEELILQKFYDDHRERVNKVKQKRLKKPFKFTLGTYNCQSRNGDLSSNNCLRITLPGNNNSKKSQSTMVGEQRVQGSWFTATKYGEYDSIDQVEEAVRDANSTRLNTYWENEYKKRIEEIKKQIENLYIEAHSNARN